MQVDIYHLQNSYPTTNWKEDYNQNKKVSFITCNLHPISRHAYNGMVENANINLN